MMYKEIRDHVLIKKITNKDKLFMGTYTVDPYQNCEFGCIYCDSTYDPTVYVRINAADLLEKELPNLQRERVIIGSVNDPYQPVEQTYQLTRRLLKILHKHGYPVHILTKSTLIKRDIDLLSTIDDVTVTFSILSLDTTLTQHLEKQVPSPEKRMKVMQQLADQGIHTGVAVIPILPYLVEDELETIVKTVSTYDASYLLHAHLELKGDQKNIFFSLLEQKYPMLLKKYQRLYENSYMPSMPYISQIDKRIHELCNRYHLKTHLL